MRLLIVSPSQGHFGGIEAFVIALASAVETWPEFELKVCFKLVQNMELRDDLRKAALLLRRSAHFMPSGDCNLIKLICWADIVHCQNACPDIVFPAWLFDKKLVLTIHNWRRQTLSFHSVLWRIGAKLADRRSRFVWNTWEPRHKSNGSDCVPTVCRFSQEWCPPSRRRGFIFVGRWIENKGIEDLLTAYSRSQLNAIQWPLILIGDGPLRARVESLISDLRLEGVEMPGFLDDQSKARRLASARWLVAPARTREDLGLTPIEARSMGVPVIVTRDGGLPEAGGEAALIVEPGNVKDLTRTLKLAAAMSDEEYCDRAERGRASLKVFLRPMEFYREAYASLVKNGS